MALESTTGWRKPDIYFTVLIRGIDWMGGLLKTASIN